MKLEKTIPAHQHVEDFLWIKRDFHYFGSYKEIRERNRQSVQRACFWCERLFRDAEILALAGRPKAYNVLLCQECAAAAEATRLPASAPEEQI